MLFMYNMYISQSSYIIFCMVICSSLKVFQGGIRGAYEMYVVFWQMSNNEFLTEL